jgi:hypothetical protein
MRRLMFLAALLGTAMLTTGCDDKKPTSGTGGKVEMQSPTANGTTNAAAKPNQ